MARPFDATIKHLVESHPADWLALAGLPCDGEIEVIDADLSSISAAADKIIRVNGPFPYIAHLEFQASDDRFLDERILFYHILLRWRFKLPVRSVVFLLRPKALGNVSGCVIDSGAADERLEFRYRVIRVWEQPVAAMLSGGLGTLPLAPISDLGSKSLDEVCQTLTERVERELPRELKEAVTATMILMGLNHPNEMIQHLFRGVRHMKESSVYQAIVEEGVTRGRVEGRVEEAKELLIRLGERRFGALPPDAQAILTSIRDIALLHALVDRVSDAATWHDLLPQPNA